MFVPYDNIVSGYQMTKQINRLWNEKLTFGFISSLNTEPNGLKRAVANGENDPSGQRYL